MHVARYTLFLAGFALQACIESTARHAKDFGYRVVVLDDAVAAFSGEQRRYVLEQVMWLVARVAGLNVLATAA